MKTREKFKNWFFTAVFSQGKGILKRRIRNEKPAPAPPACDDERCANVCKRNVTFDETISVKNDKDLVVKKPLMLVIENWKSGNAKTPSETFQPDPGIVQRLIDEFNTIEEVRMDSALQHRSLKAVFLNQCVADKVQTCRE